MKGEKRERGREKGRGREREGEGKEREGSERSQSGTKGERAGKERGESERSSKDDSLLYTYSSPPLSTYPHRHRHHSHAKISLVSSPDQIFCAHPADSSKNRVWTLSLVKLGHVYIWRSVNWVIVGVNYIISYQQHLLSKNCKQAICDDA